MKTYPLDTPINEILADQSEYSVGIEHQIGTSMFEPGSTLVYIVGKVFETEYVEQSVCVNSIPPVPPKVTYQTVREGFVGL
jgi:hypothetical protein